MKHIIKYLSITLLLTSCTLFQTEKTETKDLLPRETDVPGWKLKAAPVKYNKLNINEYVSSRELIKLYKIYGFEELSVARYTSFSNPQKEVLIEILCMNSPLNAFGILSMERPPEVKKADVCDESYSIPGGLFTIKNNYYIRAKSSTEFKTPRDDLKVFLKIICNNIEKTNESLDKSLQPILSLFGHDAALTLKYSISGDLKLSSLRKIFIKSINFQESEKTVFYTKRKSNYKAITEFSNLLQIDENPFILSSAEKLQIAFHKVNDNEITFIALYKEWIFGVLDAENMKQGEIIIHYMYNKLIDFQ